MADPKFSDLSLEAISEDEIHMTLQTDDGRSVSFSATPADVESMIAVLMDLFEDDDEDLDDGAITTGN